MKILIGNFILSIFLFLYSFNVNADPAGVNNEWSLIKDTIKDSLKDLKSNFELFIEDGSLKLISKNKKVFIFDLGVKNHDVYLVKENSNSFIYIFNSEDKRLYKSSLDDINFKELDWKFNSLMSIIKVCDIEKYYLDFPFIDKITDNSFLTKYNSLDRPDNMKCGYFIGGGRCELAYDQASGEWGSYSMMIVDNNLNYTGDLSSISSIYGEKCEFYDKIRNFSKDVSMDDLVERDGLYYEVYSDDIFTGDIVVGKEQGKVIKGKREGEWLTYYKNGEVKEKSNFKDDKQEGESLRYYKSGELKNKNNWKDGKLEGERLYYYKNGQLWRKNNYKDGKLKGEEFWYYESGELEYKYNYKNGKPEGEWLDYYKNGQLKEKSNFKDGKQQGESLEYGQLKGKHNLTLQTPFEEHDEYINFEYDEPIDGIKITGTFNPKEWGCAGNFMGDVHLVFTRLIDNKSFEFSAEDTTFFDQSVCEKPVDYDKGCKVRDNIILQYEDTIGSTRHSSNFQKKQPLKIIDFDFDGKEEIILLKACGHKFWEEFKSYKFANTLEEFSIDQKKSFYFNAYSKFDDKNKTMTVEFSSGSCGRDIEFYKSDGTEYKLIKKSLVDIPDLKDHDIAGLCERKTYDIDIKGNATLIETVCRKYINSEEGYIDSEECFIEQ